MTTWAYQLWGTKKGVGVPVGYQQKYTNRSIVKQFNDHVITVLPWSRQSPDMNPIEHLWNELDWCIQLCNDLPTSKDNLWKKTKEWNNIEVEVIHKLVKSMPNIV